MNFYQLIVGGLEEVKEALQIEKDHRIEIEKEIRRLESRTEIWTSMLFMCLMLLLCCVFAIVCLQRENTSKVIEDVIVHFDFDIEDSWMNYILGKVNAV